MIDSGNDIFSRIYNELYRFLPEKWEQLIVYLEYGEEAYSFRFYVKEQGRYVLCYDLPDIEDEDLDAAFDEIDKFVSVARSNLKSPWTNMTMTVDAPKMHTDFDYTDLSGGTYEYDKLWKERYLNESTPPKPQKTAKNKKNEVSPKTKDQRKKKH